ncbi:MAG: hypothetical protein C4309_07535 [Chloroflexota bacterium]
MQLGVENMDNDNVVRVVRRTVFLATFVVLVGCALNNVTSQPRDSRLSSAVAVVSKGPAIEPFLGQPGPSFVQAYVRFDSDLPDDVIFGIDQEFLDGVARPFHLKGGDWMAFIGLQRTGAVWIATGTDETMAGKPSKDRVWKIRDLRQRLQPNTWYRLRTEADFGTRHFRTFTIEGARLSKSFDLSQEKLDYPNYMPFSDRAMTFYVFAMRGRSLMTPGAPAGKPVVYFDYVSGGPISVSSDVVAFQSSFEEQQPIGGQPVTSPIIDLEKYQQGRWYLERDEAIFDVQVVPWARTGSHVGRADASLR